LFRIFHKKSSNKVPFLNQQHNRDERKLLNAGFVMMLPLSLVIFFYEKCETNTNWNWFFLLIKCALLTCDFNSNYQNYVTVNTNFYLAGKTKLSGDFLWILSPDK